MQARQRQYHYGYVQTGGTDQDDLIHYLSLRRSVIFNKIFGGRSNRITFPWPEIPSRIEIAAEIERPAHTRMAGIDGIPAYFARSPSQPVRDLAVIGTRE